MTLLQPNKRQGLLTNPLRRPLLTATENEEELLEFNDVAASIDLSKDAK